MPYGKGDEVREYTLKYREALPAILRMLEDENITSYIHLYPEKRYVRRANGHGNMRVYGEVDSGDDWDQLQVSSR